MEGAWKGLRIGESVGLKISAVRVWILAVSVEHSWRSLCEEKRKGVSVAFPPSALPLFHPVVSLGGLLFSTVAEVESQGVIRKAGYRGVWGGKGGVGFRWELRLRGIFAA